MSFESKTLQVDRVYQRNKHALGKQPTRPGRRIASAVMQLQKSYKLLRSGALNYQLALSPTYANIATMTNLSTTSLMDVWSREVPFAMATGSGVGTRQKESVQPLSIDIKYRIVPGASSNNTTNAFPFINVRVLLVKCKVLYGSPGTGGGSVSPTWEDLFATGAYANMTRSNMLNIKTKDTPGNFKFLYDRTHCIMNENYVTTATQATVQQVKPNNGHIHISCKSHSPVHYNATGTGVKGANIAENCYYWLVMSDNIAADTNPPQLIYSNVYTFYG